MAQLVYIQLEDGSELYMEATEGVEVPPPVPVDTDEGTEQLRTPKGWDESRSAAVAAQSFKAIESTIRTYTRHSLSAFKDMAYANVDKVTLQFGIRVGGEAGVPYVTKGTAESNLSITVECSFDQDN